ncbi:MAG TPA: phosphoribosylformylglycinamidine synthase subunit PurL [Acidimicrobiaceae bacterium]|nr:phosphoribosylformylglycinamidine synthase subunit PurL [Acidimicrobiaceae bacterium]
MARAARLTIRTIGADPRAASTLADAHALGVPAVEAIDVADVIFFADPQSPAARAALEAALVDPLLQHATWDDPTDRSVVETALLPGVTDPAAAAVQLAMQMIGLPHTGVATGRHCALHGAVDPSTRALLARRLLANGVIERWADGLIEPHFVDEHAVADRTVDTVAITALSDVELEALSKERGLSLDLAELQVIAAHFRTAGREPTDVELETLAQTWSEHCSHKTFRARITSTAGDEIVPLLRQLRDSTDAIAAPFLRSAFVGNAGIVEFTPGATLAVKAETHNHPSAIEPFGGANTGVGGVIRDVMGAAHHPIAITDILCFGPTDTDPATLPDGVLHPRLVERGVVAGVADYGNKIGLPTVAGAVLYDPGYTANPLVYAGCIGVATDDAWLLAGPQPGDLVVVLGGRTGRDGLRGATFSSATMDATTGDVAGASVQIGDPIVEKLLIDALRECTGLFTAITDCGAGGLSSAVGEMAEGVGADVDVALAPLKYPGLRPWEVWLSEAQERMVMAVPPANWPTLLEVCAKHGVEATALGTFTGDGQLHVHAGDLTVLRLDTHFLHDGRPQRSMVAELPTPHRQPAPAPVVPDPAATLLRLLAHPNIASKERIIRRYDHEIRGTTVVRPLVGAHHDGHADGVVLAEPTEQHGVALGIGVNPWYGLVDPERMAHAVVDEAMRNVVAVGADPSNVALLDNFSWGDPRRPSTLGELVMAVQGCCDAAAAYGAPFVSGKDSLNNEYLGSDGQRHAVPPTLVITAMAHVPDADATVTPDLKAVGNLLVVVGNTSTEFGGSHLALVEGLPLTCGPVPAPDPSAPARYRQLHHLLSTGRVRACHDLSEGGLAVAAAEMAIAGDLGISLHTLPHADPITGLFAESLGRFLCEVAPSDLDWFLDGLGESAIVVGTVIAEPEFRTPGWSLPLSSLRSAFSGTQPSAEAAP